MTCHTDPEPHHHVPVSALTRERFVPNHDSGHTPTVACHEVPTPTMCFECHTFEKELDSQEPGENGLKVIKVASDTEVRQISM